MFWTMAERAAFASVWQTLISPRGMLSGPKGSRAQPVLLPPAGCGHPAGTGRWCDRAPAGHPLVSGPSHPLVSARCRPRATHVEAGGESMRVCWSGVPYHGVAAGRQRSMLGGSDRVASSLWSRCRPGREGGSCGEGAATPAGQRSDRGGGAATKGRATPGGQRSDRGEGAASPGGQRSDRGRGATARGVGAANQRQSDTAA